VTDNAGEPRALWATQWATGGIPEEPRLVDSREKALRLLVETAVANGLEWDDDCSGTWIGNDDDEVRLFGPLYVWDKLAPPTKSELVDVAGKHEWAERPFTVEENAEVERILELIREDERKDQEAREAVAELHTPGGGCD
jgi:hypothetical protein